MHLPYPLDLATNASVHAENGEKWVLWLFYVLNYGKLLEKEPNGDIGTIDVDLKTLNAETIPRQNTDGQLQNKIISTAEKAAGIIETWLENARIQGNVSSLDTFTKQLPKYWHS